MGRVGLVGVRWANYFNTLAAQSFVAFAGYFLLGGAKLFRMDAEHGHLPGEEGTIALEDQPFTPHQWLTLGVIATLVLSAAFFRVDVGMGAFVGVVVLSLGRAPTTRRR